MSAMKERNRVKAAATEIGKESPQAVVLKRFLALANMIRRTEEPDVAAAAIKFEKQFREELQKTAA